MFPLSRHLSRHFQLDIQLNFSYHGAMKRYQVINKLINKLNYQRYLEIGVRKGTCFRRISVPEKVSVDPDKSSVATFHITSDEFFKKNDEKFDIIFIDGLHHAEQVEKDIKNALLHLTEQGTILLHDCNPRSYKSQKVPRETRIWNGDVWKAWVKFIHENCDNDLTVFTVNTDEGLGVIFKDDLGVKDHFPIAKRKSCQDYNELAGNREKYLNLIDLKAFRQILNKISRAR